MAKIRSEEIIEWCSVSFMLAFALFILLGSLAVLVMAVFVVRPPYIVVKSATLEALSFDQLALRDVQVSLAVEARNDESKSPATFSSLRCRLRFAGTTLSALRVDGPLAVPAMATVPLPFEASAQDVPLGSTESDTLVAAFRHAGVVPFRVEGEAKTRWQAVGLVSISSWTRLNCEIRFFVPSGTALDFTCTSWKHKCH